MRTTSPTGPVSRLRTNVFVRHRNGQRRRWRSSAPSPKEYRQHRLANRDEHRRAPGRPPAHPSRRGRSGWLRGRRLNSRRAAPVGTGCSTAAAPQSPRRPRLTTTSRVSFWQTSSAPSGARAGGLGGYRGASTSYVVPELARWSLPPDEDGFVGKQRHGRGPRGGVVYRPSNRAPRPSSVKLSPTISLPSTIQSRP
jgi:hypothetical protein